MGATRDRLTRDLTLAVGLVLLVVLACDAARELRPNTWIFRDGRFYVNVNENLLGELSLEDPFAHSWYDGELGWNRDLPASFSNIALGARGEYYHFRPYLLPVLATPFYFAFGLPGTLLFNVLCMALIGAGAFRFVRAYAPADVSALAAAGFLLATGMQMTIYNYSVDVLLLALFVGALASIVAGRGALAGVLFATGSTVGAGWAVLLGGAADVLDGRIARAMGVASRRGAFLDSTMDRFAEVGALVGLAVFFRGSPVGVALAASALGGSLLVSYARARGESVDILCTKGVLQRAERLLLVGFGGILDPSVAAWAGWTPGTLLLGVTATLAAGTAGTAVYRTVWIARRLPYLDEEES